MVKYCYIYYLYLLAQLWLLKPIYFERLVNIFLYLSPNVYTYIIRPFKRQYFLDFHLQEIIDNQVLTKTGFSKWTVAE